jgi:hypothetical protein
MMGHAPKRVEFLHDLKKRYEKFRGRSKKSLERRWENFSLHKE